jgi:flagellar biosynthetic protein FliR
MPAEFAIGTSTLLSFLAVLVRVSGIFAFLSLPGLKEGPEPIKAFFALSFTLALMPMWPAMPPGSLNTGVYFGWIASEAAFGIAVGLCLAVVMEVFLLTAHVLSLQSGLSYASSVDPNSLADSGALTLTANLTAGLLLFATGLHRQIIMALARSLELLPPGSFVIQRATLLDLLQYSGAIFSTGLRLALPVMAFLFMLDMALSLLGRINPGLQLFSLSFPAKIFLTLFIYSQVLVLFPRVFERLASNCMTHIYRLLPGGM